MAVLLDDSKSISATGMRDLNLVDVQIKDRFVSLSACEVLDLCSVSMSQKKTKKKETKKCH